MKAFAQLGQSHTSADTSLNQLAATFRKLDWKAGQRHVDFGAGKYDQAKDFLAKKKVFCALFDPFNRSPMENLRAQKMVAEWKGADSLSANNVLNVIAESEAQREAIKACAGALNPEGSAWFLVYEGDRSGKGKETPRGWQRNEKAQDYEELIGEFFGEVKCSGNLIQASKAKAPRAGILSGEGFKKSLSACLREARAPARHAKTKAGKWIGGNLYVHKSAEDVLPSGLLKKAKERLPKGFVFEIIKWNEAEGSFSFIESKDFDEMPEPSVGASWKVAKNGALSLTPGKADEQIYHHKWNFVKEGYGGFSSFESQLRSIEWGLLPKVDRSRIGTRSYWDKEVLAANGLSGAKSKKAEKSSEEKQSKQSKQSQKRLTKKA